MERFVNMEKDTFIGRKGVEAQQTRGLSRRLVGFRLLEAGIPRHGYPLLKGTEQIGEVTSGTYSPSLDTGIGMGYVAVECSTLGTRTHVDLRGRAVATEIGALPFYHRPT